MKPTPLPLSQRVPRPKHTFAAGKTGTVLAAASPDGRLAALVEAAGRVHLRPLKGQAPVLQRAPGKTPTAVTFTASNQHVVMLEGGVVYVWRLPVHLPRDRTLKSRAPAK